LGDSVGKLFMLVSCILVSHNKPDICHEAVQSLLNQTYQNWECLLVDSGVLYDQGYYHQFSWITDSRIQLIRSTETAIIRKTKAMAPWCFNECFRNGKVKGDLIVYLSDDDIFYPNAFATLVEFAQSNPTVEAMYASQDYSVVYPDGKTKIFGQRLALKKAGKCCGGVRLDNKVDYLQFCHRRSLVEKISNCEWWPEGKDTESHADGIFMEKCGALTPIYPINKKLSQNRRTPTSLNKNTEQFLEQDGTFFRKVKRRLLALVWW